MKYLTLTRGLHSQVDDDDYERLKEYKWHATGGGRSRRPGYIRRALSLPEDQAIAPRGAPHREAQTGVCRGSH